MLTKEHLIDVLHYDPLTGIFQKRLKNGRMKQVGHISSLRGYRQIKVDKKVYHASALAFLYMTGEWVIQHNVEYINGNKDDTRWSNLRVKIAPKELTQDILKEYLRYDPTDGKFFWRKKVNATTLLGIAGNTNRSTGYVSICLFGVSYRAHRLAFFYMTGEWPEDQVDHINHTRSDNRWENLRCVNREANNRNAKRNRKNTSGRVGVTWDKRAKKWKAKIGSKNRECLGSFDSFEKAVEARERAEIRLGYHKNHGEAYEVKE